MLTSCITMSAMFGRLGIGRLWCDSLNEKVLLWRSSKHLGSQTLIHLIDQGESSIRGVVLTWSWKYPFKDSISSRICRWSAYERITIRSYEAVCSIWVDWLYYKWSFPFGLEFFFGLMCHNHGSFASKTRSPFLKIRSLTFLLKALEIRAW